MLVLAAMRKRASALFLLVAMACTESPDSAPATGSHAGGDSGAGMPGGHGGGDSGAGGTASSCVPRESFDATGFFTVTEDCGRWWFVTPEGERFYSTGVNTISIGGDYEPETDSRPYGDAVAAKYESEEAWAEATAARLEEWGWNTVGSWSSWSLLGKHMPYTAILGLSQSDWLEGNVVDYFDPKWVDFVGEHAAEQVSAHADDPNLVGWFIDNELHWGPDWRGPNELFDDYLAFSAEAPGRRTLIDLLRERHDSVDSFNAAWGTALVSLDDIEALDALPKKDITDAATADRSAFLTALAHQFFSTTAGSIRAADPNHLVLGVRFVSVVTPRVVAKVAGEYLDVVSVNNYEFSGDPSAVWDPATYGYLSCKTDLALSEFFEEAGRPLLITEFGFRAADSGLKNSWPPIYPTLDTQLERADRLEAYVERVFEAPYLIGYHWFEYVDQPPTGRFDGEDNNWGLVDVNDDPYAPVVERSALVNRRPYEACFATPAGCD